MTTETTNGGRPAAAPALTITPAAQFRRGGLYRLPGSGHVVRLRFAGLYALVVGGDVPNPLRAEVTRLLTVGSAGDPSPEARQEVTRRNVQTFVELAARCLVEPRLVLDRAPDYDAGEIGADDLHDRDYDWLYFDFLQKGVDADDVARFRVG